MSEKPILFSGAMVKAILDGQKTQTRRVIKPQPPQSAGDIEESDKYAGEFFYWLDGGEKSTSFLCPYGQPGERLWVRETFAPRVTLDPFEDGGLIYKADVPTSPGETLSRLAVTWKPSIHMRRLASRLTLEIVNVRVERVQDISEADAIAEGAAYHRFGDGSSLYDGYKATGTDQPARLAFAALWDSLNAKRGLDWNVNPWCFVIEFRRVDALSVTAPEKG